VKKGGKGAYAPSPKRKERKEKKMEVLNIKGLLTGGKRSIFGENQNDKGRKKRSRRARNEVVKRGISGTFVYWENENLVRKGSGSEGVKGGGAALPKGLDTPSHSPGRLKHDL